jgi:hypothetical protein
MSTPTQTLSIKMLLTRDKTVIQHAPNKARGAGIYFFIFATKELDLCFV